MSGEIKQIKVRRKDNHYRTIYLVPCSFKGCSTIVRIRKDSILKHSGMCQSHSHVKKPFESIYNGLFRDHRKIKVKLTYEEFLEFTKIKNCTYCFEEIVRVPFAVVDGKYLSRAYFLDKKRSEGPYSKENCVACCTICNRLKGNRFTYDEFLLIGSALKEIYKQRKLMKGST